MYNNAFRIVCLLAVSYKFKESSILEKEDNYFSWIYFDKHLYYSELVGKFRNN